jgi:hypothetical protein
VHSRPIQRAKPLAEHGLILRRQQSRRQNQIRHALPERSKGSLRGFSKHELSVELAAHDGRQLAGLAPIRLNRKNQRHRYIRNMTNPRTVPARSMIASGRCSLACTLTAA